MASILITGASSGIGRELVKKFIKDGHSVWGIARRGDLLDDLKKDLNSEGFYYSVCDVSKQEEVIRSVQEMDKENFVPDVVILAAGIFPDDIKPEFNLDIFNKAMNTNLYGALNFVNIFLPRFIQRGTGQFIAISSINSFKPSLRGVGYSASKAALGISFRGLDLAYRKRNVIFSTVYLGPVATDMWNAKKSIAVADKKKIASSIAKTIKTRRPTYYIPFLPTLIARLSFMPDKLYIALTELFR